MINEVRGWELILSLAFFLFCELEQSLKDVQTVFFHMWELMDKVREAKRCTPPGGSIYVWLFVLGPLLSTDVTPTTLFFQAVPLSQKILSRAPSFKEIWSKVGGIRSWERGCSTEIMKRQNVFHLLKKKKLYFHEIDIFKFTSVLSSSVINENGDWEEHTFWVSHLCVVEYSLTFTHRKKGFVIVQPAPA